MLVTQNKKWKGVLTASGITFKNKQIVIQTGIVQVYSTPVIVKKMKRHVNYDILNSNQIS